MSGRGRKGKVNERVRSHYLYTEGCKSGGSPLGCLLVHVMIRGLMVSWAFGEHRRDYLEGEAGFKI